MSSITRKFISKTLALILLAGIFHACSKSDIQPGGGDSSDQDVPVELSLALNDESPAGRASENPNDEIGQIYSIEVFIFKPTGELDGHKFIAPQVVSVSQGEGKYYDKEYDTVEDEIKNIRLTAGKRDVYVIANPPLASMSATSSRLYDALVTAAPAGDPGKHQGSYEEFKKQIISLEDQGYLAAAGNRFGNPEGSPIGGQDPTGLQTYLTMIGSELNLQFDNKCTHHFLGYNNSNGSPNNRPLVSGEKALTTNKPFYVERQVARVLLKKVEFPTAPMVFEDQAAAVSGYNATLESVQMLNVQTQVRCDGASFAGAYKHGWQQGYDFIKTKPIQVPNVQTSQLFDPALPKSKLFEKLESWQYDVEGTPNSSPIWFYVLENTATPTYLVLGVKYNFQSKKDDTMKSTLCYYPVVVNSAGTGQNAGVRKNYQYGITIKINKLSDIYDEDAHIGPAVRTGSHNDWDEVMTVEQEIGRNLFPWTGNKYY